MGFWNLWHCHGGICPVLKTAAMTQPVGVGQDGKLWTEPSDGGTGHEVVKAYGLATSIGNDNLNVPLFDDYHNTTKLSVVNGQLVVGRGVHHIKIAGFCSLFYTSTSAHTVGVNVKISGTNKAQGLLYVPVAASESGQIVIPEQIIEVAENDALDVYVTNMATGFSSITATPRINFEVID